jgi:hypothetical protein
MVDAALDPSGISGVNRATHWVEVEIPVGSHFNPVVMQSAPKRVVPFNGSFRWQDYLKQSLKFYFDRSRYPSPLTSLSPWCTRWMDSLSGCEAHTKIGWPYLTSMVSNISTGNH